LEAISFFKSLGNEFQTMAPCMQNSFAHLLFSRSGLILNFELRIKLSVTLVTLLKKILR